MRSLLSVLCVGLLLSVACGDDGTTSNNNNNENGNAVCGDGVVSGGEQCDEGAANSDSVPDACRSDCREAYCGDGVTDTGEACDDGNNSSGDGCSADCLSDESCGNGIVDSGEECDDASDNADVPDATCRTDCTNPRCGDAIVDGDEECDEGPANSNLIPNACRMDCRLPWCGDNVLDLGEECDHGNTDNGDGCSDQCDVEPHWSCDGLSPSSCLCLPIYHGADCSICRVYVDLASTTGTPDGASWATAFPDVQSGIDAAAAADGACEVWVAQGTYYIYQGSQTDTVALASGVSVYGGFDGTETDLNQRDWVSHSTVLDGADSSTATSRVYHVVSANGVSGATLDGFTIRGGRANGADPNHQGGGLHTSGDGFTVSHCRFEGNSASDNGGAIYSYQSDLHLVGCDVVGNTAGYSGGGLYNDQSGLIAEDTLIAANTATNYHGAAMRDEQANVSLIGCTVVSNRAWDGHGGAIYHSHGSLTVTGGTIAGNWAEQDAGGVYLVSASGDFDGVVFVGNRGSSGGGIRANTSITVANSIFTGNYSIGDGGGANIIGSADPAFTNCVFAGNWGSGAGGGLAVGTNDVNPVITNCTFVSNACTSGNGEGLYIFDSVGTASLYTVVNSLFWGNAPTVPRHGFDSVNSSGSLTYSNLQDLSASGSNSAANPLFASVTGGSGTWTAAPAYDTTTYQTTLTRASATWTPGALAGLYVEPDTSQPYWFHIADNTATEIRVWGDITSGFGVASGDSFVIHDLRLSAFSPCIDTADDSATNREPTDVLGNHWADIAGKGTTSVTTDRGAYEYVP